MPTGVLGRPWRTVCEVAISFQRRCLALRRSMHRSLGFLLTPSPFFLLVKTLWLLPFLGPNNTLKIRVIWITELLPMKMILNVKVLLCTGWSCLPPQGTVKTNDFKPASEMKLGKEELRSACNTSKASEGPINGNCFCESGKLEWYLVHQLKISQHSANVCAKNN